MKKKLTVISSAVMTAALSMTFAMSAFAEEGTSATAANTAQGGFITFVLPLAFMLVLLYFMAIKPQKKREQEAKQMQDSLQIGDEIVTTGGIIGMIVRIGDDNVVIETGGERNKLRIKKWAIAENTSQAERIKAATAKTKSPIASAGVSAAEEDGKKESKKAKKSKKDEESEE